MIWFAAVMLALLVMGFALLIGNSRMFRQLVGSRSVLGLRSGHSARESSLTSAGFIKEWVAGSSKAGEIDAKDYLKLSDWTLEPQFPEVPARLLRKDCWTPKLWGKWQFPEGIITLEARAAVKSLRRVAMSVFGSQIRQLFLLDNMSLVLGRCRSRQFSLLKQIRISNSYCTARVI